MSKTERESDRRREVADLLMLPRPAERLQNGLSFNGKTSQAEAAKKERMASAPQREQLASASEPPLPK